MLKRARLWGLVAVVAIAAGSVLALAAGSDARTETETTLTALEKDPHTKALCVDSIAQARAALERARRMHVAGDDEHARLAEGLALEWARVGEELARADAAETRAAAALAAASDAGAHAERSRALLEQQLAENGRLSAELAKTEETSDGGAPHARHDGHDANVRAHARDAGAHR